MPQITRILFYKEVYYFRSTIFTWLIFSKSMNLTWLYSLLPTFGKLLSIVLICNAIPLYQVFKPYPNVPSGVF